MPARPCLVRSLQLLDVARPVPIQPACSISSTATNPNCCESLPRRSLTCPWARASVLLFGREQEFHILKIIFGVGLPVAFIWVCCSSFRLMLMGAASRFAEAQAGLAKVAITYPGWRSRLKVRYPLGLLGHDLLSHQNLCIGVIRRIRSSRDSGRGRMGRPSRVGIGGPLTTKPVC